MATFSHDAVFTDAFLCALKASCAWWLSQKPQAPFFSVAQYDIWLRFCEKIVGSVLSSHNLFTYREKYLEPHRQSDAFFTGYYEPTLYGSLHKTEKYNHPLYQNPQHKNGLSTFSRKDIYNGALYGENLELLYVSDAIDAFFLEIQGSGRVVLENSSVMRVGYDGQNGHPYTAIGRILIAQGEIKRENVSLFAIKKWLRHYPEKARTLMEENASYVYFKQLKPHVTGIEGPIGTQTLPLTPFHSVAFDTGYWPFGMILLYDISVEPAFSKNSLKGFALTQDTGGAIKGKSRFDLFCGETQEGEYLAGHLKHQGSATLWLPKKNL